jgi:hypothetical protein
MKLIASAIVGGAVALTFLFTACSSDDEQAGPPPGAGGLPPDNTGSQCVAPADCYPGVDRTLLKGGEVQCLDRVDDGYCTHLCSTDDDCCAAPGECKTDIDQVCSPFESTGMRMCFLGCERADIEGWDGGVMDENEYCQRRVHSDFVCRSSGGGSQNRKVCVPGDCGVGESCGVDGDCADGLTCVLGFRGGYCTRQGCSANADCPADSACVTQGNAAYCLKRCTNESDCSACRGWETRATCAANVMFVEAGTTGSVCVPPAQ